MIDFIENNPLKQRIISIFMIFFISLNCFNKLFLLIFISLKDVEDCLGSQEHSTLLFVLL